MRRVLCVWIPRWPIQRRCGQQRELDGHSLILFTEASRGRLVAACSRVASRYGVRPGLPLAEAQACLSNAASTAVYLPVDPAGDLDQLRTLAHAGQRFTPLVGLEDSLPPSALLLDITGCAHLFGGEQPLCQAVQRWLTDAGYVVRWALADTVGAAWAGARFGRSSMIVPTGKHPALLRSFPLEALRLPRAVVTSLHMLGLRTVGDVTQLPRDSLPGRFGPEVLRRWDQARGELPETFSSERLAEPIAALREFEEPLTQRLAVDAVSDAVLDTLLASPRLLAAGPQELRGTFRLERGAVTIDLRLVEPTRDVRHLGQLARLQLDRSTWSGGIVQVRWEVVQAGPLPVQQTELFATDHAEGSQRCLSQLVDCLSSRLGSDRVLRVRSVPDAQPEFAAVCAPWHSPAADAARSNTSQLETPIAPGRPPRLLRRTQRLEVWSVVPDGPPFRVSWQGRTHEITQAWGPERIETGWWRAPDVQRDYYRVEIAGGAQWWLFRERSSGDWFLHGFFE